MSEVKIRVVYIPYERYNVTAPAIGHIKADSLKEAVIKMLSKVRVYIDEDSIVEEEQALGRSFTAQEIINAILGLNGDGCDYIASIQNEDTGEEYLKEEDVILNEWYI